MDMPEQYSQESFSIDTVENGSQFEATLLWDNIVGHLESMKCGRHTQALRSFNNCFQGSAAVNSLLAHLSIILAKVIKREQVQILCQKLLGTGVIEDVRNKEKDVFRESRLYKHTRNHFWSVPNINSNNQDSLAEKELSRAKSAENVNAENDDDTCFHDDLNGYASDSTVSCSSRLIKRIDKKKRRNSSRKKQCSDLVLKRETGFFHFLGTKLLNSSSVRMTSSRLMLKGSDNAIFLAPGESNESLVPPETKQRRKMSARRGQPKGHTREENIEPSITRRTLDLKRGNDTYLLPLRRWSMEKMKDDGKTFPPLITVNTVERRNEDGKGHSLISGWQGSNDRLREDSRGHLLLAPRGGSVEPIKRSPSLTSSRRKDRLGNDNSGSSFLDARQGSLDPTRGSLVPMRANISRSFSFRRDSVDTEREPSLGQPLITTGRGSFDRGQPQDAFMWTKPRIRSRKRGSPGRDVPVRSRISAKEIFEKPIPGHKKSWSNTLTNKSTTSKLIKACKMKTQERSHSFSSVEDYMGGTSENNTDCTDAHNPSHPPLAWHSGNKWIVYGFV